MDKEVADFVLLTDVARRAGCPELFALRRFDAGRLPCPRLRLFGRRVVRAGDVAAVVAELRKLRADLAAHQPASSVA